MIATNPAYAALRRHDPTGQRGTGRERRFGSPHAQTVDGTWQPLVDRETFWTVQRILMDPTRTTTRPGRNKHLLTGIGRCAVCGNTLAATRRRGWRCCSAPTRAAPPLAG